MSSVSRRRRSAPCRIPFRSALSILVAVAGLAGLRGMGGMALGQGGGVVVPPGAVSPDAGDEAMKVHAGEAKDPELIPGRSAAEQAAKAIAYLRSVQDEKTGGWAIPPQGPTFPAITALVLSGMLMEPGVNAGDPSNDPGVKRAVEFILSKQQADGGIYDRLLPSYNTAISISALTKLPRTPELQERIDRAIAFLKSLQYGEGAQVRDGFAESAAVVDRTHPFYGGWGYGRHGRPDLSNSGWAVEAMKDAGVDPSDAAFQRALVFIQRTQMTGASVDGKRINDMPYAAESTQGGFIYATSVNRATIGDGQSQAGEFVESLSGGPGVIGAVRLGKGADGKPIVLTGNELERRIQLYMKQSTDPAVNNQAGNFMVVLGPSGDGTSASSFEVHFPITEPEKVRTLLWDTLSQELENAAAVQVRPAERWQGVSRLRAYGSMTYAGFKSLLYAGLKKDDPRVAAAMDWIQRNYTVEENPGLGTDGMYYYYVVMARALHALGQPTLDVAIAGGEKSARNWGTDLVARLSTLQNEDGSYRSVDDRWMEDNTVLITAYGLVALQHARGEE